MRLTAFLTAFQRQKEPVLQPGCPSGKKSVRVRHQSSDTEEAQHAHGERRIAKSEFK